jgi:hypothetical protein
LVPMRDGLLRTLNRLLAVMLQVTRDTFVRIVHFYYPVI